MARRKLRYKQTALGIVWVALQPIALATMFMIVFSRFRSAPFGRPAIPRLARRPSGGLPYPVFEQGMDLVDGEHVLIRDGARAFAAGVLALYRDRALWERLSTSSHQLVNEHWSPDAMRERLNALLETAVRRRSGAQR